MSTARLVFDDKERVGAFVAAEVGQLSSWGDFYAMGAERDGEVIAGIVFNNVGECNATVHIAVSKPTKLLPELVDHAFVYAFKQQGLKRLTAFIEESNKKSLKINSHIGFVDECVMRQAGAGGQDVHLRVLWPHNYRRGKTNGKK